MAPGRRLARFIHDFTGFTKKKEVSEISSTVAEVANALTWVRLRMTLRICQRCFPRK